MFMVGFMVCLEKTTKIESKNVVDYADYVYIDLSLLSAHPNSVKKTMFNI